MYKFNNPSSNCNPFGNFNPITTNNMPTNNNAHNFNAAYQINTPFIEKADFRNSHNYTIDPETNSIKKAKFSLPDVIGLLSKYNIDIER